LLTTNNLLINLRFFILLFLTFVRLFDFTTIENFFSTTIIFFVDLLSTLTIEDNVTNLFVTIIDFLKLKVLRFAISVKIFIFLVLIVCFLKSLKLL